MPAPARRAGRQLAEAFAQATADRPGLHEDELLDHLRGSLAAMGEVGGLDVETHEGQRFTVAFEPREGLGEGERRSQPTDLLIVSYAPSQPPSVRFTFLQARRRPGPLPRMDGDVPLARGRVNVFHWDLLHRGPTIEPVGPVRPPAVVFSQARSARAGSFAFFHRPEPDRWDVCLASAGVVKPWGGWPPAAKPRRTATFPALTAWQTADGHREALSAAGLADLGELLADHAVGARLAVPPETEHDRLTASWLAAVLAAIVRRSPAGEAELARDLHERSTEALAGAGLVDFDSRVGAPAMAIVRTDGG